MARTLPILTAIQETYKVDRSRSSDCHVRIHLVPRSERFLCTLAYLRNTSVQYNPPNLQFTPVISQFNMISRLAKSAVFVSRCLYRPLIRLYSTQRPVLTLSTEDTFRKISGIPHSSELLECMKVMTQRMIKKGGFIVQKATSTAGEAQTWVTYDGRNWGDDSEVAADAGKFDELCSRYGLHLSDEQLHAFLLAALIPED